MTFEQPEMRLCHMLEKTPKRTVLVMHGLYSKYLFPSFLHKRDWYL